MLRERIKTVALFTAVFFIHTLLFPFGFVRADTMPILSVVGLRTLDNDSEKQFRNLLANELKNSNRVKMVPDSIVATKVTEIWKEADKETEKRIETAYSNYLKGKKLYEQLEVDESIGALHDAVQGYRESIGFLRENRYLLASHLYLGMALVIRGNMQEGKDYIRQMIVLDPARDKHALPPREFPPKIVSVHSQLTKEVMSGPMGTVSVRSRPSGGDVYLDGVQQPATPVDLKNVPVGEHFIMIEKKGYARYSQRVLVPQGGTTIDAKLVEWDRLTPYNFGRRTDISTNELLYGIGSDLASTVLVLGKLQDSAPDKWTATAQLYDTRSKEFSKVESVVYDKTKPKKGAEDLSKRLLSNLTRDGLVIAQIRPDTDVEANSLLDRQGNTVTSTPVYKTWWFWTAIGLVLVGGAGGYFFMSKKSPNYHILNIDNPLQ